MTYRNRLTLISCLAILLFIGFPRLFSFFPVSKNQSFTGQAKLNSPFKIKSPSLDNLGIKNIEETLESNFAKSILRDRALFSLSIQNQERIREITRATIKDVDNLIIQNSVEKESSIIPIPNFITANDKDLSKLTSTPWEDFQRVDWENISNINASLIPKAVRVSKNLALPEFSIKIKFKNKTSIDNLKDFLHKYLIGSKNLSGLSFEEDLKRPDNYTLRQESNDYEFGYLELEPKSLSFGLKGNNLKDGRPFEGTISNLKKRNSVLSQTLPFGKDGFFVDFKMLELFRPEIMAYLERSKDANPESTFFETATKAILSINKGNLSQLAATFQDKSIEQGRACLSLEEKDTSNLPHWEDLSSKERSEKNSINYPNPDSLLGFYSKSNQLETLLQAFPNTGDNLSYQLAQVKNKTNALLNASDSSEISLSVTPANLGLLPELSLDISSNTLNSYVLKESTPSFIKSFIPEKAAPFIHVNNSEHITQTEENGSKKLFRQLFGVKLRTKEIGENSIRIKTNSKENIQNSLESESKDNADFSILANTNFIIAALSILNSSSSDKKNSKIDSLSSLISKRFSQKTGNTYSYSHKAEKLSNNLVCLDMVTQKSDKF